MFTKLKINFSSYRVRLFFILCVFIFTLGFIKYREYRRESFVLDLTDSNINHHEFFQHKTDSGIVFIGSSNVDGIVSALKPRLQVPVYSLSQPLGNLLNFVALDFLAASSHPRLIILVFNAEESQSKINLLNSPLLLAHFDEISSYFSPELVNSVREKISFKVKLFSWMVQQTAAFTVPIRGLDSLLYRLRDRFFHQLIVQYRSFGSDPYLSSSDEDFIIDLFGREAEIVHGLHRVMNDQDSKLLVVFAPSRVFNFHEKHLILKSQQDLRLALQKEGVSFLDYSDLFNRNENLFVDYIHLTEEGAKLLSSRLAQDISGFGWSNPQCERDEIKYCSQTSLAERGACLQSHRDSLSRDCLQSDWLMLRPKQPCLSDVARFCSKGEFGGSDNCLMAHFLELSTECKKYWFSVAEQDPCNIDIAKHCSELSTEKLSSCLWKNYNTLTESCRETMAPELTQYPCKIDRASYCDSVEDSRIRLCYSIHHDQLSELCRRAQDRAILRQPCLVDQAMFCPSFEGDELKKCLLRFKASLSALCLQSL